MPSLSKGLRTKVRRAFRRLGLTPALFFIMPMSLDCGICTLRPWHAEDAERLSYIASDRNVSRYMTARFQFPYTLEDAHWWIGRNSADDATNFAILVDGEIAGGCGYEIGEYERSRSAEIGYWLSPPYWRRGIATAAFAALTAYAFEQHDDLLRLQATIYSPNGASARVAEKCGYVREGVLRKAIAKDGDVYDAMIYAKVR
jgi:RimJ/RimL family protein N-acetyltransferase